MHYVRIIPNNQATNKARVLIPVSSPTILKSEEFWTCIRGVLGDKSWAPTECECVYEERLLHLGPENLSDQQAIAHVLGTLDDKIELNRRMNQTLEEMARAIFQDWFVDFGPTRAKMGGQEPYLPSELWDLFPDNLVDSELGEIPEGWDIMRIEDVAERVAMGPFGSSIKVSTFVDSGVPIISGQHLNGMLLEDGDYRFITEDHADKLARSNVQSGDIVFTHAGNIGQAAYVPNTSQYTRYVISQRQFYMRCDTSKISPLFVVHFFKTQEGQHQLLANTSSTGVPSIARPVTYLRSIMLCLPPKDLWIVWDKAAGGFYRAVARNNRKLSRSPPRGMRSCRNWCRGK